MKSLPLPFSNTLTVTVCTGLLLALGSPASSATTSAANDVLDRAPSLFDLPPDVEAPEAAPTPNADSTPYDSRLNALRHLDHIQKKPSEFPDFPTGTRIHDLSRVATESQDDSKMQTAIERISFETLWRELDGRKDAGETDEILPMLRDALNQFETDDLLFRIHERISFLLYEFAVRDSDPALFQEAADHMESALDLSPSSFSTLSGLAGLYLYLNEADKALATLSRVEPSLIPEDNQEVRFALNFNYACAYAMKGDPEKGVLHLEQAAEADPANTLSNLGDPQLDNLRDEERYKVLDKKLRVYVLGEKRKGSETGP